MWPIKLFEDNLLDINHQSIPDVSGYSELVSQFCQVLNFFLITLITDEDKHVQEH